MTKIKLRNMLRNVVAYTTLIQKTDQHTSRISALQDEIAEEVELLDQVTAGITVLMTKYGDDAMALLEELMPFFGELVDPSRPAAERRVGICVLDDIIEHSPAGKLQQWRCIGM